jgi:hypothetical protein
VFDTSRRVELDDGRTLVVTYGGEEHGWSAYVAGESRPPASATSPAEAIGGYLGLSPEQAPGWARQLSEGLERELSEASRYVCDCCGYRTLLNPGYYEICDVCGWEDDRNDTSRRRQGPDALSGPNHISLSQARANFARSGAAMEGSRRNARAPRPEER